MLTSNSKRICLWSVPRSGSTYVFRNLVELVITEGWTQFDTVFNRKRSGSEPFRRKRSQQIFKSIKKFQTEQYWIAKVHNIDIRNLKEEKLYNEFLKLPDYNILLLRKDLFEASLSQCVASIKQQWTNNHDDIPIEVSTDKFIEMYNYQLNYNKSYDKKQKNGMNFDKVIYTEDLTDDPNDIWRVLTGKDPVNPIINCVDKSPDKIKVVTNYYQLKDLYNEMRTSRCP